MLNFIFQTEYHIDDVLSFYDEKNGGECIEIENYKNYDLFL